MLKLVPTVYHTFKIGQRGFSDGTKINMNKQEDRKRKSGNDMHQSGQVNSTNAKNVFYDYLGKYQGKSTQDKDG
jgi:outer membrane scaffolding protein for murein synthesis (MipA/OmpV family)